MEPELGKMDFVVKHGTHMNVCQQTNGDCNCSLQVKTVGPTLLGGGPWSLC